MLRYSQKEPENFSRLTSKSEQTTKIQFNFHENVPIRHWMMTLHVPTKSKTRLNCRLLVKWLRKWSKFAWTSSDVFGSLRKIVGNPRKSLGQFRKSRPSDKAKISQISISFDWEKVGGYTTGSHGQPWGTPDFKWQGGWSKDFLGFELSISGLFRVGKFWQVFFGKLDE